MYTSISTRHPFQKSSNQILDLYPQNQNNIIDLLGFDKIENEYTNGDFSGKKDNRYSQTISPISPKKGLFSDEKKLYIKRKFKNLKINKNNGLYTTNSSLEKDHFISTGRINQKSTTKYTHTPSNKVQKEKASQKMSISHRLGMKDIDIRGSIGDIGIGRFGTEETPGKIVELSFLNSPSMHDGHGGHDGHVEYDEHGDRFDQSRYHHTDKSINQKTEKSNRLFSKPSSPTVIKNNDYSFIYLPKVEPSLPIAQQKIKFEEVIKFINYYSNADRISSYSQMIY